MNATAAILAFPVLAPTIPGMEPTAVGIFLAVVYVGAMIGSVLSSAAISALGPLRTSQAALLLQAIGLALLVVESPSLRFVAALLCGLGYGPITPASSQILVRNTAPDRMGVIFSLKQTGVPLGGLLAGALLPLLSDASSWEAALICMALTAAFIATASERLRLTLDIGATGRWAMLTGWYRPIVEVLAHPSLRSMAGVSLIFSACQLSVSGYLMAFLHREIGLGLAQAGLIYALSQGAGMVGRLAWGHLADWSGSPRTVMMVIALLMTGSALCTGFASGGWLIVTLCAVVAMLGATAIGWNGIYLSELARVAPPDGVASVTGGALFFTYLGVVVGPPAFGYLAERANSLGTAYVALSSLPLLALALLAYGACKDKHAPDER
ncbi:MFS transporter [Cupriavidus necator]